MNQISMPKRLEKAIEPLRMTNTGTSVFMDVIVLSGSELAATNREKEFVIWLAQRDQNIVGRGTVGFHVEEMPWKKDDFHEMKNFLLRTIQGAMNKTNWHVLDYEPSEEWCRNTLEHFFNMVQLFDEIHVDAQYYADWITLDEDDDVPTIPEGYQMCKEHPVYLSCLGCIICNSQEQ
ncbi:hypothetical protein QJQ58_09190 [Paenibacillus dendritiformis]|uniref:hypothetical protein n=1 Tax=Paenibacillus dendritiformis TaxID=130049 RepID=UPI00248C676D|nr:hypothetical protein [Paenibacillus dendritiformis]WGU96387.1 hypothetical protein QJQ58_09190 [Paenibacillus dendritiformis]